MSDDDLLDEDEDQFPWEDVEAARRNQRLQREHPVSEGKQRYAASARPCPKCHTPAEALSWFYFESPAETWEHLCGRAGWITVCDHCRLQVDFFLEVMN
jgi:hypothetical protein